jgi:hypothetical protein
MKINTELNVLFVSRFLHARRRRIRGGAYNVTRAQSPHAHI